MNLQYLIKANNLASHDAVLPVLPNDFQLFHSE